MEFTGERFVPECQGDIALAHYHRYYMAMKIAAGKNVLDIACGEGYGSMLLKRVAKNVVGVDISKEAIEHAKARYSGEGLTFLHGSAAKIPLGDSSVDVIVSFETIEHLHEQEDMIREFRRVLTPSGVLLLSSPEKGNYQLLNYDNPFHVRELYRNELCELVRSQFKNVKILGQQFIYASIMMGSDGGNIESLRLVEKEGIPYDLLESAIYLMCYASNSDLPQCENSVLSIPVSECSSVVELQQQLNEMHNMFVWKVYLSLKRVFSRGLRAFYKLVGR